MSRLLRGGRRSTGERGQALTEFAILFPILALILFSILQFGLLYGGQTGLVNAAREAARYAAVLQTATTVTATPHATQTYGVLTATTLPRSVPGYVPNNLVTSGAGRTAICYESRLNADGSSYSVYVRVQVVYRHQLIVPLASLIVDGIDGSSDSKLKLTAVEEMRVENPVLTSNPGALIACP